MKIDVTYEKKDILRLVQQDLQAKGIRVKPGTALEYKGALQIRLAVDTEDEVMSSPSVTSVKENTVAAAPPKAGPRQAQPVEEDANIDLAGLAAQSQRLSRQQKGKFEAYTGERKLVDSEVMQESLDYPTTPNPKR